MPQSRPSVSSSSAFGASFLARCWPAWRPDRALRTPSLPADGASAVLSPRAEKTTSGYTKRVRGANTPNTNVLSARGDKTADAPSAGKEGVRNALSGLQAGQQRAKTEGSTDDQDQEEGR